jgi:bifunctional NMN adenylyltransferase/nudix hydrolase
MDKKKTVGVVIGRFQVSELHQGHRHLIEQVLMLHKEVLVLIGDRPGQPTRRNPLDYRTREIMLINAYPDQITVSRIQDHPSDDVWSEQVDECIAIASRFPEHEVFLYGSRDSFIRYYSGHFTCVEIAKKGGHNGSRERQNTSHSPLAERAFRQGVIYMSQKQYFPTAYGTIDVAIFNRDTRRVLLGRKRREDDFRFIGGFVDPSDTSLEHTVRREAREEAGDIEIGDITYIGSTKVDDWRYRKSESGIMTSFFVATYIFGRPQASDDIVEVQWFDLDSLDSVLIPTHRGLGQMLTAYLAPHT